MYFSTDLILFAVNLALATLICGGLALTLASFNRSLPIRHATLAIGLVLSLLAPALVGVGTLFPMGQLPEFQGRLTKRHNVEAKSLEDSLRSVPPRAPLSQHDHEPASRTFVVENSSSLAVGQEVTRPTMPDDWDSSPMFGALPALTSSDAQVVLSSTETWRVRMATMQVFGTPLILIWLLGIAVIAAQRVRDWQQCHRLVRMSRATDNLALVQAYQQVAARFRVAKHTHLLVSSHVSAPVVIGFWRPAVILPADALAMLSTRSLQTVLVHELSHIARRDHWLLGIQVLARTCYWWNPLIHWVSRKMAETRELICDDLAVQAAASPRDYARSIVEMAERSIARRTAVGSLGIGMSSPSELERRIRRIMVTSRNQLETRLTRRSLIPLSMLTAALLAVLAVAQVPSSTSPAAPAAGATIAVPDRTQRDRVLSELDNTLDVADNSEPTTFTISAAEGDPDSTEVNLGFPDEPLNHFSGQVLTPDGQPAPQAALQFMAAGASASWVRETIVANADGRFSFTARLAQGTWYGVSISATSHDGKHVALWRLSTSTGDPRDTRGMQIRLEKQRTVVVEVVDQGKQPVEGANVAIQLAYPHTYSTYLTNSAGKARIEIPESERVEGVVAWKDDLGLDYHIPELPADRRTDADSAVAELPGDEARRLILSGAAPVTVHVADEEGEPLANVRLSPPLLSKGSDSPSLNLSVFQDLFSQWTDDSGVATFRWLPTWHQSAITIWPIADGYARTRESYEPATGDGHLEISLYQLTPIRGQVRDERGNPAQGIEIEAYGAGRSMDQFRGNARTDVEGRYEVLVAPFQIYLVAVRGPEWAAAPRTGFAVYPRQPAEGLDFQLRKPTRVHGQLLNQETREPLAHEQVFIYHYGMALREMGEETLPNPEKERWEVRPTIVHAATTNDMGEFTFQLGDGDFDIRPPQQETAENFTISGDESLQFTVLAHVPTSVELSGTVIRKADNEPIAAGRLSAASRSRLGRDWRATTDGDGRFTVQYDYQPIYLHAISLDQRLAAIVDLPEAAEPLVIELEPVGAALGRLLDANQRPVAGQVIDYGVMVPRSEVSAWTMRFGGTFTTGEQGEFELSHLVPGWEYRLSLRPNEQGVIQRVATVTIAPGERRDLGDVPMPAPYEPYVPPTFEERIEAAFNVEGTPVERYARALELIELVNQHLLVVFGEPSDPRVRELMRVRFDDPDFRPLSDEFRFMAIPTDTTRVPAALDLASELDEPLPESRQPFQIVILDVRGQKVASAGIDELCVGDQLSKDRLLELLRQHLTKPLVATRLLLDARERAATENKRVLIQETATWCGPCHRLSRLLDSNRSWEKDYIWVKMDHRWIGARELMAQLRGDAQGGIPWFVILDAEGKLLAMSNLPDTGANIGFPAEPSGRAHFGRMLKSTRQRMTDDEIDALVQAIDDF